MKKIIPLYFLVFAICKIQTLNFGGVTVSVAQGAEKEKIKIKINEYDLFSELFLKLEMDNVNGKKLVLNNIKAPIIILNFWASWCQPCLAEFPSLVNLKKNYNDQNIKVIAINLDESNQEIIVKKIYKKYQLNFDVVIDKNKTIFDKFKIASIPVSIIFINKKVHSINHGAKDFNSKEMLEIFSRFSKKSNQ